MNTYPLIKTRAIRSFYRRNQKEITGFAVAFAATILIISIYIAASTQEYQTLLRIK